MTFTDGFPCPPPASRLIVDLDLSLFAWRNAKHNEVQVQTQTPLPIPVYLTRWDAQTAWRHPHRQAGTVAEARGDLQGSAAPSGDGHMARRSIQTMCLLYKDPSLSVPMSFSLFLLLCFLSVAALFSHSLRPLGFYFLNIIVFLVIVLTIPVFLLPVEPDRCSLRLSVGGDDIWRTPPPHEEPRCTAEFHKFLSKKPVDNKQKHPFHRVKPSVPLFVFLLLQKCPPVLIKQPLLQHPR